MEKGNSVTLNSELGKFYNNKDLSSRYLDVTDDVRAVYPVFADSYAKAIRNTDFYMGRQWSSLELKGFRRQLRPPYVFNRIFPIVNNLLGAQLQTKMDVQALPIESTDEYAAQIKNKFIKWFEQVNNIDQIESEVFRYALLQGYSATQTRWEYSDFVDGYPLIERIPQNQLIWDVQAIQQTLEDARWQARIIPMQKADAIASFPEYAEEIENAAWDTPDMYYMAKDAIVKNVTVSEYGIGFNVDERGIVWVVEHYERVSEYEYVVVDSVGGTGVKSFDNEKDAEDYYAGIVASATENGLQLIDDKGEDTIFISKLKSEVFLQSIIIGNKCVSYKKTDLPAFPYHVYIPIFWDGDWISPVDTLISSQRFSNRMISEWDNQMTRNNKNMVTVKSQLLEQGYTIEQFVQERSRAAATIPVRDHDAIRLHPNQAASSDFPNLLSIAQQYMLEAAGGANILGLQENAAESSKAVKARQAAAGLARLPLFRSLEQWRRSQTELALWYCQEYISDGQTLRIIGEDNDVQFIPIERGDLDSIKDARTDIAIDSAVDSSIAREASFESMKEFFQATQGSIPPEIQYATLLELNPHIPKKIKESLQSKMEFHKQYMEQLQKQAMQEKLQAAAEKSVEGQALRDKIRGNMKEQSPDVSEGLSTRSK